MSDTNLLKCEHSNNGKHCRFGAIMGMAENCDPATCELFAIMERLKSDESEAGK